MSTCDCRVDCPLKEMKAIEPLMPLMWKIAKLWINSVLFFIHPICLLDTLFSEKVLRVYQLKVKLVVNFQLNIIVLFTINVFSFLFFSVGVMSYDFVDPFAFFSSRLQWKWQQHGYRLFRQWAVKSKPSTFYMMTAFIYFFPLWLRRAPIDVPSPAERNCQVSGNDCWPISPTLKKIGSNRWPLYYPYPPKYKSPSNILEKDQALQLLTHSAPVFQPPLSTCLLYSIFYSHPRTSPP